MPAEHPTARHTQLARNLLIDIDNANRPLSIIRDLYREFTAGFDATPCYMSSSATTAGTRCGTGV